MLQTSTLRKRSNLSRTIAALIASGGLFLASSANAADGTWLGVAGNWSAGTTWSGGIVADGAGFTANFTGVDITAARTITLDSARTIGNIIFTDATTSSHNLTISGANVLTLDVASGASTLNVTQSGRTMTISSVIAGDDPINKTGDGILLLGGANTFSGQLSVQAGVLQVATLNDPSVNGVLGNSALPVILGNTGTTGTLNYTGNTTASSKPFTLATGGTGAFNVSAANTQTITLSGLIDGSGNLTKLGNANLKLTGANTYTGVTTVSAGRLVFESDANVANPNPLGQSSAAASNLLLGNATTLQFLGSTAASIDRNFTINGTAAAHGATLDSSGTAPISFTNTASPAYGATNQTRNLTLGGTNTGVNTFAANLVDNGTGAVSLNKSGNGVWYVSGTNTNTGQTNLSGGVMVLASATALPSSGLRFTNGAVLGLASGDFTRISGAANAPAAGTFSFGSDGGFAAYGADRMVNMGGAGGNVAFGSTANATVASLNGKAMVLGATTATHTLIWMNGLDSGTVTRTLTVADGLAAVDAEIRGVLTSTVEGAGLLKNGTGTLLLSNANTIIGPLNIAAGKVMVSNPSALGAGSPTNIVTVANDAVLDLNGTNLTIATPLNLSGTGIGGTGSLINSSTSNSTFPGQVTFGNAAVRIDGAGRINLSNTATITGPDTALTLAGAGGNIAGGLQTGAGGSLTANSTGTWTLNGVSNYNGATAIDGGTLALAGTAEINGTSGITVNAASAKFLQASSVAVAPTVTLTQGTVTGSGTINTVNVGAGTGGIVSNNNGVPGASLTIGTLTFNGAATVNTFSSGTSAAIVTTALATDLAGTVTINPSAATWTDNTTHNLISYAGGSIGGTGGFSQFTLGTVSGLSARQVASALGNSGTAITLTITGDTPYWTGDGDDNWNLASVNNWKLVTAGTATTFLTNDNVLFNDNATGAGPINVTIDAANVAPNSTVFNNITKNYVLNGTGGFGISTGSVVKNGAGMLTINSANTHTGGTTINAGTVVLGNASALGTGTLTINGGSLDSSVANLVNAGNNAQLWNSDFTFVGTQNLNLGTGAVTLSGNRIVTVTANNLTVGGSIGGGSASLTKLGSGTLTLAGGGTFTGTLAINAGTVALTPPAAGAFTLSNAISGTGTLNVNPFAANSSNVTLGGDLTGFTGTVNVATSGGFNSKLATTGPSSSFGGGTVVNVASGGTWYSTASQSGITVNLSGTGNSENLGALRMDNASLDSTSSVVLKSNSAIGGTGTTTINAPISEFGGSFGFTRQGSGTMFLSGTNTYSGLTTVSTGALVLQNTAALGTTAGGTTVADGARVELDNLTITGEAITIAGAGGDNLGALRSRSGASVWTGPVTIAADLTRIGAITGSTFEVSGVIDDGVNDYRIRFRPNSAGTTIIVSGANTYTGGTSIFGGTVVASSLNKVVGGTASSSFGAPVTAANGMIILGIAGTVNNGTLSYVGAGETTDRTIQIGDNSATPASGDNGAGAIENNGTTGALVFSAPTFNSPTNALTGTSPTRTLTLGGTNTAANTISGIIQNNQIAGNPTAAVAITKAGSGTWVLGGANTYTGTTTINEGKLLINGNNTAATGPVNVNAAAILGGSGIVGGLTTVNSGFVAPGNSAGNLTFANGLDLAAAGIYTWELGALSTANPGTNFDTITVSGGNLALGSSSTLTLDFGLVSANDPNSANPFWTSNRSWKIIDVTGTGTNTGDTSITTITNGTYTSGTFTTTVGTLGDAGDIFLVFTSNTVASSSIWQGANNDNWTAASSWNGSVPNSASAEARFETTGGTTAVLNANQTINKLTFDAAAPHTISGGFTLSLSGTTPTISTAGTNTATQTVAVNLDLAAGTAVSVQGGTLALNSPANAVLGAGVTATVASGATLSLGGTGNALSNGTSTHANVANSGTLLATTAGKRVGEISGNGTTTVTAAGATLTANHIRQSTLNIGAGNTVTVATNGGNSGTSTVTNLNINATGKLDLANNDLIVDNGNLATLTSKLATGLDINGTYGNGPGITSSAFASNPNFNTVLGIAANVELGYTSFSGQTVDANDILIKYTYYGDADLSGSVDTSTDFDLYITGLTSGGSLGGWLFGDFDYSGTVDSSTDFDLYITGLTTQGGALLTAGGGGNLVQAVPEPSTFVLGGLALLGFAGVGLRRRRLAQPQA